MSPAPQDPDTPTSPPHLALRPLHESDLPAILVLVESVGWDSTADTVTSALALGVAFGHALPDGSLVSCAVILSHGGTLASIGLVMVHPAHRRRGLGATVVRCCLDALREPVMLVATPQGERLYERLGFRTVGHVHRLVAGGPLRPRPAPGYRITTVADGDLGAVLALDADVFGADRGPLVRSRWAGARESALLMRADGRVIGYALLAGQRTLTAGPLIAPDAELASALLASVAGCAEGPIRVDLPASQEAFRQILLAEGFAQTFREPLMLLRAPALPGRREALFAFASVAFG